MCIFLDLLLEIIYCFVITNDISVKLFSFPRWFLLIYRNAADFYVSIWHLATLPSAYLVSSCLISLCCLSLFVVSFMNLLRLFRSYTWILLSRWWHISIIKHWPTGKWSTSSGLHKNPNEWKYWTQGRPKEAHITVFFYFMALEKSNSYYWQGLILFFIESFYGCWILFVVVFHDYWC